MEWLEPGRGVDRDGEDLLRAFSSATCSMSMPPSVEVMAITPPASPIHQHGGVVLARDVAAFLDVEPAHGPSSAGPVCFVTSTPPSIAAACARTSSREPRKPDPAPAVGISLEPARAPSHRRGSGP